MTADILLQILTKYLEVEILYQQQRKLDSLENEEYHQGYIQALKNIELMITERF